MLLYSPVTARTAVDMPSKRAPANADTIIFLMTVSLYLLRQISACLSLALCPPPISDRSHKRRRNRVARREANVPVIEISEDARPRHRVDIMGRGLQKARR